MRTHLPNALRRGLAAAVSLAFAGAVIVAAPAAAAPRLVTSTLDDGSAGTLRYEIVNSAPGDEILFDPTVFGSPQVIETTSAIIVPHDLTITGPGPELLTIQRNDAGGVHPLLYLAAQNGAVDVDVTISGIQFDDEPGNSPLELRQAIYADVASLVGDVTLRDLVIRDQDTDAISGFGGGVSLRGVDAVTIDGVEFVDNTSDEHGGALAVREADSLTITNSSFDGNTAEDGDGGAVLAVEVGSIEITGSEFTRNQAIDDGSGRGAGGAVFVTLSGPVEITGSTFGHGDLAGRNTADTDGGAVAVYSIAGDLEIAGSEFLLNEAGLSGGGVYAGEVLALDVTGSLFDGNVAGEGGALFVDDLAAPSSIRGSVFLSNRADSAGGAILFDQIDEDPLTVTESTFTGNEIGPIDGVAFGGAIYVGSDQDDSLFTIERSTFSQQGGSEQGQAFGLTIAYGELSGEFRLVNSTIDEHEFEEDSQLAVLFEWVDGGSATIAHSTLVSNNGVLGVGTQDGEVALDHSILVNGPNPFIESVVVVSGDPIVSEWSLFSSVPFGAYVTMLDGNQAPADPDLGPLQDNGGPTETREPAAGSPAIGAGNPAIAGTPATDQRGAGFARVVGVIDIGAVEVAAPALPATGATASPAIPLLGALVLGVGAVLLAVRRRDGRQGS